MEDTLLCCGCKQWKPKSMFHRNKTRPTGYHSHCKPCKKISRDLIRQTEEYKKYFSKLSLQWRQDNPEKYILGINRRRTSENTQIAPWVKNNKKELKEIAKIYKLARDLTEAYGFKFHVDHIVPLNSPFVSGFTCSINLEPLSAEANMSKGNRRWPDMQENLCLEDILRDSEGALSKKNLETSQVQSITISAEDYDHAIESL